MLAALDREGQRPSGRAEPLTGLVRPGLLGAESIERAFPERGQRLPALGRGPERCRGRAHRRLGVLGGLAESAELGRQAALGELLAQGFPGRFVERGAGLELFDAPEANDQIEQTAAQRGHDSIVHLGEPRVNATLGST